MLPGCSLLARRRLHWHCGPAESMAYVCDCGQALWALLYRRALGAVAARRRSRRCLRGWFRHLQRIQVIMPRLLDTTR